jgi:hypothetical protein
LCTKIITFVGSKVSIISGTPLRYE